MRISPNLAFQLDPMSPELFFSREPRTPTSRDTAAAWMRRQVSEMAVGFAKGSKSCMESGKGGASELSPAPPDACAAAERLVCSDTYADRLASMSSGTVDENSADCAAVSRDASSWRLYTTSLENLPRAASSTSSRQELAETPGASSRVSLTSSPAMFSVGLGDALLLAVMLESSVKEAMKLVPNSLPGSAPSMTSSAPAGSASSTTTASTPCTTAWVYRTTVPVRTSPSRSVTGSSARAFFTPLLRLLRTFFFTLAMPLPVMLRRRFMTLGGAPKLSASLWTYSNSISSSKMRSAGRRSICFTLCPPAWGSAFNTSCTCCASGSMASSYFAKDAA